MDEEECTAPWPVQVITLMNFDISLCVLASARDRRALMSQLGAVRVPEH